MNSIQLASVICLGACVSPDATLAFPLEEQEKVQVIAAPDYPVPSSPLEEACYTPQKTDFSVWAPSADQVELRLYKTALSTVPDRTLPMSRAHDGLWNASLQGDLKGEFYTFRVQVDGQWQAETAGIFAKAVGVNGDRGAIIDWQETNPTGWEGDRRPSMTNPADIVVYEMHHRDFSIHPTSGIKHKGKFLALTERGTVTAGGEKTGIDHLKELGITHVHILPSFDFATIDETTLNKNQYNWGYDPKNYNVPEGSYSTDPYDPKTRIKEFKEMVQALHQAGIRVVLDVVYNHTFSAKESAFERTVPGYFYRMRTDGSFCDGSACGNETASDHPMMRKYIIESVCYWAKEYHLDGFRFDLMAIHDIETMNQLREALNKIDPSIITYGEGWAVGTLGYDEDKLAYKKHTYRMPGVSAFSDDMRDALRGPFSDHYKGAFLAGIPGHEEGVKFGIAGGISHDQVIGIPFWAGQPTQHMSYVSCHDDHCLRDRLVNTLGKETPEEELIRLDKLAQTAVLTSQGVPFIFCGEELFRTKQGVGNSYKSPDSINAINWNDKQKYHDLFAYYRELIAIRRSHPAFYLGDAERVREHLEFLDTGKSNLIAFQLKDIKAYGDADRIVVVLNSNTTKEHVAIPQGRYRIYVKDGKADRNGLEDFEGKEVKVAPRSALILISK